MPVHASSLIVPITHHQHSGSDSSSGQETDYASAHEVAMGRRILTTLASRVEPTKDSIVLTNSPSKGGAPDRSHGGASGKLSVEETGTLPPARSPIPRSNPSEPPDIKQIGGSGLRAAVPGPHGLPFADVPGQIAPGNTRAVSVEDALDHLSGVGEGVASSACRRWQVVGDEGPLVVSEQVESRHDSRVSESYPGTPEAPRRG